MSESYDVFLTDDHRRAWARKLIDLGLADGPLPRYGSPEWAALPAGARRVAAVVWAAEAWFQHCTPTQIRRDLEASLAEIEAVLARRMKYASWDISAAADWRAEAAKPSYAELQRRRSA